MTYGIHEILMECSNSMAPKKSAAAVQSIVMNGDIFESMGLADIPKQQKSALVQKLLRLAYQRVIARIMDALPSDAIAALKKAIADEDESAMAGILLRNGLPLFAVMMAEEALYLKYEMETLAEGDAALGA